MRTALRWLIALNWTVVGLACYNLIYGHDHNWWSECVSLARDDMKQYHPDLVFGREEYSQQENKLAVEYRKRTEPIARRAAISWGVMMGAGTVTAIGLIAVFRIIPKPPPN